MLTLQQESQDHLQKPIFYSNTVLVMYNYLYCIGFEGFQSNIDPEELFRNIFGNQFKMGGNNPFGSADFAESNLGFAAASEVILEDKKKSYN